MGSDSILLLGILAIGIYAYTQTDLFDGLKAGLPAGGGAKGGGGGGGAPVNLGGLSPASAIASTETMTVPPGTGGVVILIPNEGHHGAGSGDCLTAKNCEFLPKNIKAPTGIKVAWLSDDAGHDHTITVTGGTSPAGAIKTDAASKAVTFATAGKFTYKSKQYPQTGTIEVGGGQAGGANTVGAIFCPAGEEAAYEAILTGAGMKVVSKAPADKVAIIVYSSPKDVDATAMALAAVTKKTPWT